MLVIVVNKELNTFIFTEDEQQVTLKRASEQDYLDGIQRMHPDKDILPKIVLTEVELPQWVSDSRIGIVQCSRQYCRCRGSVVQWRAVQCSAVNMHLYTSI